MVYNIGPRHDGPSLVDHTHLEGTYSEMYPEVGQDAEGKKMFERFSVPTKSLYSFPDCWFL